MIMIMSSPSGPTTCMSAPQAAALLQARPDVAAQQGWLAEVVIASRGRAGRRIDRYIYINPAGPIDIDRYWPISSSKVSTASTPSWAWGMPFRNLWTHQFPLIRFAGQSSEALTDTHGTDAYGQSRAVITDHELHIPSKK